MRWWCLLLVLVACEDSRRSRDGEHHAKLTDTEGDELQKYEQLAAARKRIERQAMAQTQGLAARCAFPPPDCLPTWGLFNRNGDDLAPGLDGSVVVLDFWASWSGASKREASALNAVVIHYDGQPVTVLGMNAEGLTGDPLFDAADTVGIHYAALPLSPEMTAPTDLPTSYIYDKHGNRRDTHRGAWTAAELIEAIDRLLAEP